MFCSVLIKFFLLIPKRSITEWKKESITKWVTKWKITDNHIYYMAPFLVYSFCYSQFLHFKSEIPSLIILWGLVEQNWTSFYIMTAIPLATQQHQSNSPTNINREIWSNSQWHLPTQLKVKKVKIKNRKIRKFILPFNFYLELVHKSVKWNSWAPVSDSQYKGDTSSSAAVILDAEQMKPSVFLLVGARMGIQPINFTQKSFAKLYYQWTTR